MTGEKNLSQLLDELDELFNNETDAGRKKNLADAHARIAAQHRKNIKENVKQDSKDYASATQELNKANEKIGNARGDAAMVAEGISQLAKVVDLLAKAALRL